MTHLFFAKDHVSHFDIFEKYAQEAVHRMKIRLREGYPVDFQDVASRFTIDSATEFLFGKEVCTLAMGIVYPPSSPLSKDPVFLNHPANRFVCVFQESQVATAQHTNYGFSWHFTEFWKNKVEEHMKVCFESIDPIIVDTLAQKREKGYVGLGAQDAMKEVKEEETLWGHLVNFTEGCDLHSTLWDF